MAKRKFWMTDEEMEEYLRNWGWGWLLDARMYHLKHWEPNCFTGTEYEEEVKQLLQNQYVVLLGKLYELQKRREASGLRLQCLHRRHPSRRLRPLRRPKRSA
jgi:hypothetical protein